MMHERHPQEPRDIKPPTGVAPAQGGDRPRHDDARDEREVVRRDEETLSRHVFGLMQAVLCTGA